jgi:hypothetical protein
MIKQITKPTTRPMTAADIPSLVLEHEWLREVYYDYFDEGRGPAWVLEDEDGPVACFGATILWDGVCEVWFSLIRTDRTIVVIRNVKRFLEEQGERFGIRRFHATISDDVGRKFVKFFGFKCETPEGMKSYNSDGSTAWLYSRTV